MSVGEGPTMRRRQLGMELRRLREAVGLHLEDVATAIGRVPSTVSRIETGKAATRPVHLRTMLDLYRVPAGSERDALVALAQDAQRKGWWSEYDDVISADFERYLGYEGGATGLRVWENRTVPGLLQTADYARAAFRAGRVHPDEVDRRVEVRLKRQEALTRPEPLTLWVVLDEAVLHRMVGGPATMRAQLDHLATAGQQPHVHVYVVPFTRGAHAGIDGPFTILEFTDPTDPDVVYVDGTIGNLYLEKARDLRRHTSVFHHLLAEALPGDETTTFIQARAKEIP